MLKIVGYISRLNIQTLPQSACGVFNVPFKCQIVKNNKVKNTVLLQVFMFYENIHVKMGLMYLFLIVFLIRVIFCD